MDEFQKDNSVTREKQKKAYREHIKELEKKKKAKEKKEACAAKVFCFDSLHNVEVFAESVCIDKHISSKLYKDTANEKYYLFIKKGKLKFDEYMKLCRQLMLNFAHNSYILSSIARSILNVLFQKMP